MTVSLIINGILTGCIYSLIAIGLTVVFGVMRLINMFHGEAVMLGMYAAFFLFERFGISPYWSVFLTAPLFFLFALLVYRLLEPIPAREREMSSLIITLGISFVLSTGAMLLWSADYRTVLLPYAEQVFVLAGTRIGYPALLSSGFALLMISALYLFLTRTFTGRAIRATALDPDTAACMGVNVRRISYATFGLGVTLAAVAGGILSPIFYIYPFVGGTFVVKAFVIVVLGGMGSVTGALFGGILLGISEALTGSFLEHSMKDSISFLIFLALLLFRPSGLFGARGRV